MPFLLCSSIRGLKCDDNNNNSEVDDDKEVERLALLEAGKVSFEAETGKGTMAQATAVYRERMGSRNRDVISRPPSRDHRRW